MLKVHNDVCYFNIKMNGLFFVKTVILQSRQTAGDEGAILC